MPRIGHVISEQIVEVGSEEVSRVQPYVVFDFVDQPWCRHHGQQGVGEKALAAVAFVIVAAAQTEKRIPIAEAKPTCPPPLDFPPR